MSSRESDALLKEIYKKYKNSWEQTRLTASAFGGSEGIEFPWDDEKSEETLTTQEDIQLAYNRYVQSLEKK
jgi:hypothetical protein